MNYASRMRRGHRVSDLDRERDCLGYGQLSLPDPVSQRDAAYVLHHHVLRVVDLLDSINRDDVRMVKGGCCQGFAEKALPSALIRGLFKRQTLDRHRAVQVHIGSAVHDSHTALAQPLIDSVM